jgi:hypothetical protein
MVEKIKEKDEKVARKERKRSGSSSSNDRLVSFYMLRSYIDERDTNI